MNPAFLAASARPVEALLGQRLAEVLPDLAAAGDEAIDRVLRQGLPDRAEAVPLSLGTGQDRLWDLEVSPVRAMDGRPAGVLAMLRDVTAQQAALRAGEAARATLDALFRHVPEGLILAEAPDARLTRVSDHALRVAGREAAEVLDRSALLHPGSWQVFHADGVTPARPEELPLTRAVQAGEEVQHETWVLRGRDGRALPILCSAGPIREEGGRIRGGILCFRDVTELREAEAALAWQEARYRALVEAGALAVWRTTAAGELLDSASWSGLTGQSAAEMRGTGWLAAIHPEDRETVRQRWAAALAGGESYEGEYRLHTAAGCRWTAARAVPRRGADGRILEWVGVNTDIEARKRAEQELRASEERFRILATAMPHLVWQTNAGGRPEYLSDRWREATGLDLPDFADGGWMRALHPEDIPRLRDAWAQALASGGEQEADARLHMASGEYRWHRIRAAPVRDAAGHIEHWVGTCTDVERRRRVEAQVRDALAAQERLLREAEHRIKNSLQLVAALLRLQGGRAPEPAVRAALEAATLRVQAVAEAHRALQRSADLRSVGLADMLRELAAGASVQHPGADLRAAAPDGLALDAERAIPLALILSELVAEALRGEADAGTVRLAAGLEADRLAVSVTAAAMVPGEAGRLGETIIRALARQIGAELSREALTGEGMRVTLRLALEPAAEGHDRGGK